MAKWMFRGVMAEPPSRPAGTEPRPGTHSSALRRRLLHQQGRLLAIAAGIAFVLLVVWAVMALRGGSSKETAQLSGAAETAPVERRDFVRTVRIHGTVEAVRYHSVAAPRLTGPGMGSMIITKLIPSGAQVKRGDLLVEFDRQNQIRNALDREAEYRDLLEQIKRKQAEHAAARARDDTELEQAKNALQAAQLEMRRNEVISRIDAEKNQQNLEEARASLMQLQETFELKQRARQADLRVLEIQRDRARNAMLHAQRNAEKMAIRSPLDGVAVVSTIWKGGQMAEVQEGDEVRPGASFMLVVNPAAMQVRARVNQADVLSLRAGMLVQVRLDAYPDLILPGRVEHVAAIGVTSTMSQRVRTFVATISVQGSDPRVLPDLSAAMDIEVERQSNVLVAPRDALGTENGEWFVQVQSGRGFEKRRVNTGGMSEHEVVIESGVEAGASVLRHNSTLPSGT